MSTHDSSDNEDSDDDESIGDMELPEYVSWDEFGFDGNIPVYIL